MATFPLSAREARALDFFSEPGRYLNRNYRIAIRASLISEMLGDTSGKHIIDLGCGDGAVSANLSGQLTLIDSSPAMIAAAQIKNPRASLRCMDLHDIDQSDYDIALCIGVLAHVDDTSRTLEAVHRCLRPGGLLVLQLSDHSQPLGRLNSFLVSLSGKLAYRPTAMADVLSACGGFNLIECRRHFLVPAGLSRLFGRLLLPLERLVSATPWLACHAGDAMLLLRKRYSTE